MSCTVRDCLNVTLESCHGSRLWASVAVMIVYDQIGTIISFFYDSMRLDSGQHGVEDKHRVNTKEDWLEPFSCRQQTGTNIV